VQGFLDSPEVSRLLVFQDGKDLVAANNPPAKFKKKTVYFLKVNPVALTNENMSREITCGDFGDVPLEHFSTVWQEVFMGVISNPHNQKGWPDVMVKEVNDNLHRFIANVFMTVGHTKGKTLLPLPPTSGGTGDSDKQVRDKDHIHLLENAVVTWSRQIKNVLKSDPEAALKEGLNPGPLTELEFWTARSANLNSIHEQLQGEQIQKVVKVLELSKSTYFPAFHRLCREVALTRAEANDNIRYLRPLKRYLEKLSTMDDFPMLVELFKPLMHTLLMVWKHSKNYNTASRLVILMRMISNDLIAQACRFVQGEEIFQIEPQEAVARLKTTLKVCGTFKSYYFDYKARTQQETPDNPWRFQNSALFARLDSFLERCHDILDLCQTVLQFNKLEQTEIGGTKGKSLTTSVRQIFSNFSQAVNAFQTVQYDIMDVQSKQFDDDFYEFRCVIKDLERRLGHLIIQAFDDCTTIGTTFKLLDSFEGLLERELIATDLEKKHMDLLTSYGNNLRTVETIFREQSGAPQTAKNSAPHSGAVAWARGLKDRIEEPMAKLEKLSKAVMETPEAKDLHDLYASLCTQLESYEQKHIKEWYEDVAATGEEKLKLSLLIRDDNEDLPLIHVNFDPDLVKLLREVKYFTVLGVDIPAPAQAIFVRADKFRSQTGNLEIIAITYNNVLKNLLPVEKPLIEHRLQAADQSLQKGLQSMNWNSHKIDDYLAEVLAMVKDLSGTLTTIKNNVETTRDILSQWSSNLMFERKEGKTYTMEELLEAHSALTAVRYAAIEEGGKGITKLLSNSNRTLKVSKGAPAWKDYVEYVSEIVTNGMSKAILVSIDFLKSQIDPEVMAKNEIAPLIEIELELLVPDIVWKPDLGQLKGGVQSTFDSWIKGFLEVGTLTKRLDTGEGSYSVELEEDFVVRMAISEVQELVLANQEECIAFKESYRKFEYLWVNDLNQTLREFLEANAMELEDGTKDDPSLERFDEEINKYKEVQDEIQALTTSKNIGWIRVDAKPIKQALSTTVTKWIFQYTSYLSNKVTDSIDDLYLFIEESTSVLSKTDLLTGDASPPDAAEAEGGAEEEAAKPLDKKAVLYEVMGCMRDIRKRMDRTEAMFEPLKATVQLLKSYNIMIPDAVLEKLESAPTAWTRLKKDMFKRRDAINQMQLLEAREIRERSDGFNEKVENFRAFFQKKAPFGIKGKLNTECLEPSYLILDHFHSGKETDEYPFGSVTALVEQARYLNECQELFELFVSDYVHITRCSEEMLFLKEIWDMVARVVYLFNDWHQTLWDKIDVDFLVDQAKKLQKEMKQLSKGVRNFDIFKMLDEAIKAMLTSLPLVADLHHPAMRERHWKQLMKATGKHFTMDEKFNLGDLLALELHSCVDEVSDIVDRAQKELVIEKALKKIDETWSSLTLSFVPFPETEICQMMYDEVVQETLESDNLALQNMSAGKYVQGNEKFLEIVTSWQKKLGTVDSVLIAWTDVQKKWSSLESIFVGSADIRVQLPEDSKRFDGLNAEFQDLQKSAVDVTNVVEACNYENRLEMLEKLLTELEVCEKALQDYLETKRIAFPRFYFCAPAALLDILAKGSNPQLVVKHLPKCFDGCSNLEFKKDDKGEPTKIALGMYSKEKEYVPFAEECACDGPVETWLGTVEQSMQKALSSEFKKGIPEYEEVPRKKWMFQNSVQNTITVSRVFFTHEVNEAFEALEDGNDEALRDEWQRQVDHLAEEVDIINGELTKNERKKLITLCTIDVHARDVMQRLMDERVEEGNCFQWQSQLRYLQNEKTRELQVDICDAQIPYSYEYIGICGCLCITPLTDRCYITLTQAQRLCLGGAPAGPAGTGKTETVKDLSRALGIPVYVFNCSDQMDYNVMGGIYKGLAQTGAWGCFDEFNRIPVAVLSVCSTQYKTVLDAIRAEKDRFIFNEVEVKLLRSVMAFITMNPGYPGRAELPESLKALFRPVSMCVPDLALICEIMLMAEGFQMAKILSRKFVILYKLCEDLLSKSAHYDWKLRAIKTTLYVAGGMKRAAPELSEDKVLLRALRDFNLGKLTSDDTGIFMGLLNDLFPKTLELVPRAVDKAFDEAVVESCKDLGYQPDPTFCLKISQLREIFEVRWSVFLLGPAGSGKTAIWKVLQHAQNKVGEKSVSKAINPKAVTRNELYGFLHPSTREWKEGLMSVTFRDFSNNTTNEHQWIVLDGDIDAEWIESMNTVMDDNKMLTLASNERIPLTDSMRLLLEINHMVHCSPATVSRGGVVYVNAEDIGWAPIVESWVQSLEATEYRPTLTKLFSNYLEKTLEYCRKNFKTVVPLVAMNIATSICKILEGMIPMEQVRGAPPPDVKLVEYQFVYACIWAVGGTLLVDKVHDYQTEFSKWWISEWKSVTFPEKGLVFDYFVSDKDSFGAANPTMMPWEDRVEGFHYSRDGAFSNLFVPTVATARLTSFLDSLMANKHYVMFVGNTGTGKTAIMSDKLKALDTETTLFTQVNMNSFTEAWDLQPTLESVLEKKSGTRFGPVGSKRLIYFVDDMNMPKVDKYDTQSAIEIVRQYVDYGGWFDKQKIVMKDVLNTQLCACMNPTAGSFYITPRMQRHFVTFGVQMPSKEVVQSIYSALIEGHMGEFDPEVTKYASKVAEATVELHSLVMNNFLPSAVKFHYQFNLRELSNVMQGMCRMVKEFYADPIKVVRLWVHECERVFLDRMVSEQDMTKFGEMRSTVTKKYFQDLDMAAVEERPLIYTNFMTFNSEDEPIYLGANQSDKLKKTLEDKLEEHNESNAVMDLVLFNQAVEHVTRITRIIDLPEGNAMLVGVGGSGKQSLARLAAFICGHELFQVQITGSYGINDFKEDFLGLYQKTGVKGTPVTFLMTDNQIVQERMLIYINDFLTTGEVSELFTPEDKDGFCNSVRGEVKQAGIIDTAENCWDFFINKVRKNLHLALCFSPVGDKFRIRARQFPGLVNCTVFDWFHSWPHEALVSVAARFLKDIPNIEAEVRENIAYHMAFAHQSVSDSAVKFKESLRRFCYTTPKSYLELISLYDSLLAQKRADLKVQKDRLENGVDKIAQASAQVKDLQTNLQQEQIIVEEKKSTTDALIVSIGQEKAIVDDAVESSRGDEEECSKIAEEVMAFQAECEEDLKAAEPIIQEAEAALNSLDKNSLGELKSFGSPAAEVVAVVSACMVLTSPGGKIPKDLSWNAGKKMMGDVNKFLKSLVDFDKDNTPVNCVERVEKDYLSNPNFNADYIRNKSGAAAGLCAWVANICKYYRIYEIVAPKRAKLDDANKKLSTANNKLKGIRAKVKELQDRVASLEDQLMKATEDKNTAIAQAAKTQNKAALADRLINGLSGENKRWGETIEKFGAMEGRLVGDSLLASAFVSYAGPFTMEYRHDLVEEKWIPDMVNRQIPMTEGATPLDILTTGSQVATWNQEGLPTDSLSIQNGAIMNAAARWSLMVDPQLQGVKWIVNREEQNGLKIIQLSQNKYLDAVQNCIENGIPLLIENLPEDIDAVLDPVIGKQTIKRGRATLIKVGEKEVEYDPNFRLFLQTKLSNPHYKPEINAQATIVNFCVTEKGLEDQLLSLVVAKERPDLQQQAADLRSQLAQYTITIQELEDNLLFRLANSQGDILEDIELIENLEETKKTANDIQEKVEIAKETEATIATAREAYRPVASRGSLMYFLIDTLSSLDRVYHFSMANFLAILDKGIDVTPGGEDESKVPEEKKLNKKEPLEKRVELLIQTTSITLYQYVNQGLFERHKLIVATQLGIMVLRSQGKLDMSKFDFLLRGPKTMGVDNPVSDFVSDGCWATVQALREIDEFAGLADDLVGSAKRWREWIEFERPEDEPLPGDWKRMPELDRLMIFRALRPDRLTAAMTSFVSGLLGKEYVQSVTYNLARSFEDTEPGIPTFVFLSPGVDVAASVEKLGAKFGISSESEAQVSSLVSVSLGQGQENIAMNALKAAHKDGGWVLLQNIHLTIEWTTKELDKVVDKLSEGAHENFRLFLSAEAPPALEKGLPISLLQNSIKLTNEPPEGLKPNLIKAYASFTEDMMEGCAKPTEFRAIVFALSYFHAALLERKKFGVGNLVGAKSGIGWNMNYPFNTGDLLCCGMCTNNYLENNTTVPWDDLRYIFGEIMYGGHIVEDWDRRLAFAYLTKYMNNDLLEGVDMFPKFHTPPTNLNQKQTLAYIEETMPAETPLAYGLHPNAEIGFKLREADAFCSSLLLLQPRQAADDASMSPEDKAKMVLDELVEKLPEPFDMEDIRSAVDDFTPYVMVAIQESERMNRLLVEMKRSLAELDLGLKGDLTMSEPMEAVMMALAEDRVPGGWGKVAYPSLRPLGAWVTDLLARVQQLVDWTADLTLPKVTWLPGLFNPQSFLTAVMQTTARRNDWPLDKTVIVTDVTKKQPDQIEGPARDGAYIHGLTLEGARWDEKAGLLEDSQPKELFYAMPVIQIKAVTVDKAEQKDTYQCPVYTTEVRFRQEVFTAQLKCKGGENKWILAGVCMFLDVY